MKPKTNTNYSVDTYSVDNKFSASTSYSTRREDNQRCSADINKKTGEIRQKSAAFFAYNKENYKNKVQLAIKNPIANSILEFMVSEMDNTNALCISMATLESLFKMKRNAISKHIKYLSDAKFLTVFKIGNMNAYAINAYLVWTQGDANLYKAKFAATMYLTFDEQTPKVKAEFSKTVINK